MGCFSKWDIGGCGCQKGACCAAPCSLPADTLAVTTNYNGGGSGTIAYQGNCVWLGCLVTGSGAGIIYTQVRVTVTTACTLFEFLNNNGVNCTGVFGGVGWYYMSPSGCGSTVATAALSFQSSSTCNPLSLVFRDPLSNTTFTVSYSGSYDSSKCTTVRLQRQCTNSGVAGIIVKVYTSLGGTLLDTQTTGPDGTAFFTTLASGTTYYAVAASTPTRYQAAAGNITGGAANTLQYQPAAGYQCFTGCPTPASSTLNATINGTATTLTGNGINQWTDGTSTLTGYGATLLTPLGTLSLQAGTSCPPSLSASYSDGAGHSATVTE